METFISFIALWPLKWAPKYWALCHGAMLSISENTALFSLIGNDYGGDGRINFQLPDFRGRVPVCVGTGIGLSTYPFVGNKGGLEGVRLLQQQMPQHTHTAALSSVEITFKASAEEGTESVPGTDNANTLSAPKSRFETTMYNSETPTIPLNGINMNDGGIVVGDTGNNALHENRQPYLVVNYIIALQGIFPSRN